MIKKTKPRKSGLAKKKICTHERKFSILFVYFYCTHTHTHHILYVYIVYNWGQNRSMKSREREKNIQKSVVSTTAELHKIQYIYIYTCILDILFMLLLLLYADVRLCKISLVMIAMSPFNFNRCFWAFLIDVSQQIYLSINQYLSFYYIAYYDT